MLDSFISNNMEEFAKRKDKFESLYTIICHGASVPELKDFIFKKLEIIDKMKDMVKKKYLNDRVYSIIEYLKTNFKDDDKINHIFLVGETIEQFKLSTSQKNCLDYYQVKNIWFENGEHFKLDEVKDLIENHNHYEVLHIDNNKMFHQQITSYKRRSHHKEENRELDILEYLKANKIKKALIFGVSGHIKKIKEKTNHIIIPKKISHKEILDCFFKDEMTDKHKKLEDDLKMMKIEKTMHRFKVGKDLAKALDGSEIMNLYVTPKRAKRITKKLPHLIENVKFFCVIERIEKGDIYDTLDKDFDGAYGITYF